MSDVLSEYDSCGTWTWTLMSPSPLEHEEGDDDVELRFPPKISAAPRPARCPSRGVHWGGWPIASRRQGTLAQGMDLAVRHAADVLQQVLEQFVVVLWTKTRLVCFPPSYVPFPWVGFLSTLAVDVSGSRARSLPSQKVINHVKRILRAASGSSAGLSRIA